MRSVLRASIAGAWLLAPAADFREIESNSPLVVTCVTMTIAALILCGFGLAKASARLGLSTLAVVTLAIGELLALSLAETAAVFVSWGPDTFKYLLFRQIAGWLSALLIVVISSGMFLYRSHAVTRAEARSPEAIRPAIIPIVVGLIAAIAIAYAFAQLRIVASSDAIFRAARAAESVFFVGLPALLLMVLLVGFSKPNSRFRG